MIPSRAALNGAVLDARPDNRSISTYKGDSFDIFDPSTWWFDTEEIAISLCNTCRFAGQVEFYSVGEHSLRVAKMLKDWGLGPKVVRLGLYHDGVESVLVDIPRPWKDEVKIGNQSYKDIESEMEYALFEQLGLLHEYFNDWDSVKRADMEVYREESAARPSPSIFPDLTPLQMRENFLLVDEALIKEIGSSDPVTQGV